MRVRKAQGGGWSVDAVVLLLSVGSYERTRKRTYTYTYLHRDDDGDGKTDEDLQLVMQQVHWKGLDVSYQ